MNHLPQISEAEFEVMKIVWKYAPINTNEITERLRLATTWSPKTIHTLIKRLVTKGALSYEKQLSWPEHVICNLGVVGSNPTSSFLKRFYHGDLTAMVSSFLEEERLSDQELEELRLLLSQKKGEH